eukprot:Awhi_evm1s165
MSINTYTLILFDTLTPLYTTAPVEEDIADFLHVSRNPKKWLFSPVHVQFRRLSKGAYWGSEFKETINEATERFECY